MKSVSLGRKSEGYPEPATIAAVKTEPTVHYPSLYIEDVEGLPEIPEEGVMTIRYKLVRREEKVQQDKVCLVIDVTDITDVEAVGKDSEVGEETSEALDKLVKTLKKSY